MDSSHRNNRVLHPAGAVKSQRLEAMRTNDRQPLGRIDHNVECRANITPILSKLLYGSGKENVIFDLNLAPNEEQDNPIDLNSDPLIEDLPNPPLDIDQEPDGLIDLNLDASVEDIEIPSPQLNEEHDNFIDLNVDPPTENLHSSSPNTDEDNEVVQEEIRAKKSYLSDQQRRAIYDALLERSIDGKLKKDTTKIVAELFSTKRKTVRRIWNRGKNCADSETINVSNRKVKNCGRKRIEIDTSRIRDIPLNKRTTLASLAAALGSNKTRVARLLRSGSIRRHSNAIKPYLKEENKKARLKFCISMLEQNSLVHEPKFVDMFNMVYIDEKWFCMTKRSEKYYLLKDEEDPLRMCKSKNFIGKVMFLAAIARPRFDSEGNETFSGKIGIFPFITKEPAKRNSVNRTAGTMETKPITSVTRDIVKLYIIEKVLPAIRAKWPISDLGHPIFIQQDNARTHIDPNDQEFREAASLYGFDIRLICQPPNSPDLNILDLGFFRAIQSLQQKHPSKTIDELVFAVEKSFEEFSVEKSNHIFLTMQLCMIEVMKIRGSNNYKIPHINKTSFANGYLPVQANCDPELVQNVLNQIANL